MISHTFHNQSGTLEELIRASNRVDWDDKWDKDSQFGNFSADQYMVLAREHRLTALKQIKRLLETVPNAILKDDRESKKTPASYYSLDGRGFHDKKTTSIDLLIEQITQNKDDPRFLKERCSVCRKLKDYETGTTPHPEAIGDYLRFQIICDNAYDIALARHTIQFGNIVQITSQKDRLRRPCKDGGHRAFLAHALAQNETGSIKFEVMLSLFQAETLKIDKTLRDSERTSLSVAVKCGNDQSHISNTFFALAGALQGARRVAFLQLYSSIPDFNKLLDEDVNPEGTLEDTLQTMQSCLTACSGTAKKLPTLQDALSQLAMQMH